MLDPTQAERMGRNLAAIVRYAPRLDAAKYPRAGNVENAGLAPAAPRSRPPALMHPVDLEITACDTLSGWLANLAADAIEEWTADLLDRWADQVIAQMRHEHEKNITDTGKEDQR